MKTAANLVEGNYEYSQVCDYATKMTPILFINDELVSSGQVLSVDDLRIILSNLKEKKR